jgi:hypothetical protein
VYPAGQGAAESVSLNTRRVLLCLTSRPLPSSATKPHGEKRLRPSSPAPSPPAVPHAPLPPLARSAVLPTHIDPSLAHPIAVSFDEATLVHRASAPPLVTEHAPPRGTIAMVETMLEEQARRLYGA